MLANLPMVRAVKKWKENKDTERRYDVGERNNGKEREGNEMNENIMQRRGGR